MHAGCRFRDGCEDAVTASDQKLALHGGVPVITADQQPVPQRRWGSEEFRELSEVLEQDSLFYWRGPKTAKLIEAFKFHYPLQFVMPCSSGTASIHIALLAMNLKPGEEVITSPITDQGTVIGILYQQGVPVFADLDPHTYNLEPKSVEQCITPRTRAILAVHLAGNPCDLDAIKAIAHRHNLILIEDCAQAWGARYRGAPVGTIGHVGCFSLNDFKHISCGDGGVVASSDPAIGPRLQICGDKGYDRVGGSHSPRFLAPCYRMSELQAAVSTAQLGRVTDIAERRNHLGECLTRAIANAAGVFPQKIQEGGFCSYWFYMFRISTEQLHCTRDQFVQALNAEGLSASAGYIPEPLYRYPVFRDGSFFGGGWPVRDLGLTRMDYNEVSCPNAELILHTAIRVEIRQWMTIEYIQSAGAAIHKVASYFSARQSET